MGSFEIVVIEEMEVVLNSPTYTGKFLKKFVEEIAKPENKDLCDQFKNALNIIQPDTGDENLNATQACAFLKIGRTSLWSYTRKNIIIKYKLNGRVLYRKSELIDALNKIKKIKRV